MKLAHCYMGLVDECVTIDMSLIKYMFVHNNPKVRDAKIIEDKLRKQMLDVKGLVDQASKKHLANLEK